MEIIFYARRFWCHQQSPIIHPVGWAQIVGHELIATPEYAKKSLEKAINKKYEPNDASWSLFKHPVPQSQPMMSSNSANTELKFRAGMKLEAIDPLNLSCICVATVTKVLRNNYLMIGIDGMMDSNGSDWFCYHATSPCIFPVGFCTLHNIQLKPPIDYNKEFTWFQYLKETQSVAAPVALFKKEIPNHRFREGMYLEAVDIMEPRLICVAKVTKVVGRLLRIHFVGWDENYDQWCDCESPELFPVGWCESVGYQLEKPPKDEENFLGDGSAELKTTQANNINNNTSPESNVSEKSSKATAAKLKNLSVNDTPKSQSTSPTNSPPSSRRSSVSSEQLSPHTRREPKKWKIEDVIAYLQENDCGHYAESFKNAKINGEKFLKLTRDDLLQLTNSKLGPSLKMFALIQKLAK